MIEQRTVLIAQLRQALHEHYPSALAAFDDWTSISSWDFIISFPTPQAFQSAARRKWVKSCAPIGSGERKLWRPD